MIGNNGVSRKPVTHKAKWESLLICLLDELNEKYRMSIVCLCTIPLNPDAGSPIADFMNGNATQCYTMIRNLIADNPSKLRLMDVETALRRVDHSALTRDGIHFNTQQGIQWINDAFQTKMTEMQAEVRMMVNPVVRCSPAVRVESHVPQPLAIRLEPLTTEANVVQPTPSSDVRERLGTAPTPRGRSLENRHGTRGGPPQVAPQATTSTASQPTRAPSAQRNSQADPAAIIDRSKISAVLWKRPGPSPCGRYKADMVIKLDMKTLTCHVDAKKMLNGHDPTVSGLYRIAGADWLLAEEEQFSSAATLRLVDLEGLPRDTTMGSPNTSRKETQLQTSQHL